MADSNLEWHENHPVSDPRLRRLWRWIVIALFVPGTMGIYLVWVLVGGEPPLGVLLAGLQGGLGGALLFSMPYIIEAGMPTEVAFGPRELRWRTRSGKIRSVPYDDIRQVVESMWKGYWKDGKCQKYIVDVRKPLGLRRALWVTPDNRDRLEAALRRARARQVP